MDDCISRIAKYLQSELGQFTKVAWLLGSYSRGDFYKGSDLDLVIVTNNELDTDKVNSKVHVLSQNLEKEVDITNFTIEDAKKRVEFNDYLLASLLEEEKYLFGDEGFLREIKKTIFSKNPSEESIKYNLLEGIQTLDMGLITFDNFRYYLRKAFRKTSPEPPELAEKVIGNKFNNINFTSKREDYDLNAAELYLFQTVRNCVFAIGYLLAADKMKTLKSTVSLKKIKEHATTIEEKLFNELFYYEKQCKKSMSIDPLLVEKYLTATAYVFRNYFASILSISTFFTSFNFNNLSKLVESTIIFSILLLSNQLVSSIFNPPI